MASTLFSVSDFAPQAIAELYEYAAAIKNSPARFRRALEARQIGLVNASGDSRWTLPFITGLQRLGAQVTEVEFKGNVQNGPAIRAALAWGAMFCDCIIMRGFDHAMMVTASQQLEVPLINAGSNQEEPVQALADFYTIAERWETVQNLRVAFVGPPTPRFYSLLQAGARLGVQVWIGCPEKQQPRSEVLLTARLDARQTKGRVEIVSDAERAVRGSEVIYVGEWGSNLSTKEIKGLSDFTLTKQMAQLGKPGAIIMHPGGGLHGPEAAPGVLDLPNSIVQQQVVNQVPIIQSMVCSLLGMQQGMAPVQQLPNDDNVENMPRAAYRPKQVLKDS